MNALKVIGVALLVSACQAVPSGYGAVTTHQAAVVAPAKTAVLESYHAGPAVAKTHVQHGIVGSRTVQVGSQPIQVGHKYVLAGQSVHQPPSYTINNNDAYVRANTVPLPAPAIPAVEPIGLAAIPPAPVNLGPAPADTVTQQKILAPARAHTEITPRVTNIVPELHVNRVPVDAPFTVPVPVHRDVVVTKNVQRPVPVDQPYAVAVPVPQKVHPVQEIVRTPVIRQHTVSVQGAAIGAVGAVGAVGVGAVGALGGIRGVGLAGPALGAGLIGKAGYGH